MITIPENVYFGIIHNHSTADDVLLLPCKCNNYVDPDGFGLCNKRDKSFDGMFTCYVDYPSSCVDVIENPKLDNKLMSGIACEDKNEGKLRNSCVLKHRIISNLIFI